MNLCWITFDDVSEKSVRVISIKNRIKYFPESCNVTIISPDIIEDKELKSYIIKNIVITERIYGANFKSPTMPLRLIKLLKKISKEIVNFDVIITDTAYVPLYKYFSKKKVPVVMLVHGIGSEDALSKNLIKKGGLMYKLIRIMEKKAYEKCDKIIAVSEGRKEYLINEANMHPSKISVIPNAVDPDLFNPNRSDGSIREKYNLNEDPVIIFVGSFRPWHNVENIVYAFKYVIEEIPNAKLVLVGDGPTKQKIETISKELGLEKNIIFTGRIPYQNIPSLLNASDVCVASFSKFRNEKIGPAPIKVFEYMAVAKPVVSSNIKDVKEVITKYDCGILIDTDNIKKFSNAIIILLSNKEMAEKKGKNGRKAIVNYYNWKNISEETYKIFNDLHNSTERR